MVRTYVAVDSYGNVSEPCNQNISLRRIDLDDIDDPDNFELMSNTNLTCNNVVYDSTGFPTVSSTGIPTINGFPIYPVSDFYCNLGIEYDDQIISQAGCLIKIMRTWTYYESWCTTGQFRTYNQIIEIADTEDPVITCPESWIISTDGATTCNGTTLLPLPGTSDDCGAVVEIDISYDGGFFNNIDEAQQVTLPAGVNVISYTIYDSCDNSDSCQTSVTVQDDTAPVARCDSDIVVSLRSDGTSKAYASTFDEGSFDDCAFYKTVVRRMDMTCDCDLPEFDDFEYIGEREGRYYYLSSIRRFGLEAFNFSSALDGQIFTAESSQEYEWVNDQVRAVSQDPYLIGLEKDDFNNYTWPGHVQPIFSEWASGQPDTSNDNVIVNVDGEWETVNADIERYYFVMELSNICGFSDAVNFCCDDAAEENMILLRAIDRQGRTNECMLQVEIQDKVAPVITCPFDRQLNCDTNIDINNLDIYGTASATDQCVANVSSTVEDLRNNCGAGQIIRTFTAADNTGESTCSQILNFQDFFGTTNPIIDWPDDYETTTGCMNGGLDPENLPEGFDFPDFLSPACSDFSMSHTDQVFNFAGQGSDACLKILRTWTVTDHCKTSDPNYAPDVYEQSIKVNNTLAPEINSATCTDVTVSTADCDSESVNLFVFATDDCTENASINGTLHVDFEADGNFEIVDDNYNNTINYTDRFDIGSHVVLFEFEDLCGNRSACTRRVEVTSSQGPIAVCASGITTTIQDMDLDGDNQNDAVVAMIIPEMLDAANVSLGTSGSSHPCGSSFEFSFSSDLTDQVRTFDCNQLGVNEVDLWVTDEFGNTDVCTVMVEIQDSDDKCGDNTVSMIDVHGKVLTEELAPVLDVEVYLNGQSTSAEMTDYEGSYAFDPMNSGGYYVLSASKDKDYLDGVSTLDLVLIQRHILGMEKLNSPYKLIAADVDNSQSISAIDLIELRKLILGIDSKFRSNTSWRMIDAQYDFIDPQNPFAYTIPEDYEIFSLQENMEVDFIGVKIGDVNNSITNLQNVDPEFSKRANSVDATLEIANDYIQNHHTIELPFEMNTEDIQGLQMGLSIDPKYAEVIGVKSLREDINIGNFNTEHLKEGMIRLSWVRDQNLEDTQAIFSLILKMKDKARPSDFITVNEDKLYAEYYKNSKAFNLGLGFREDQILNDLTVYQNTPNPWINTTNINFDLAVSQNMTFTVYDINGRVMYQEQKWADAGFNTITLSSADFNTSGIMYYEIKTEKERIIKKMIMLN